MNKYYRLFVTVGMLVVFIITTMMPVFASVEGRKNTAIVLSAATIAAAFRKNKTPAVALGLGSAAAWKKYEDARKHESILRSNQAKRTYYRPATYRRSSNHRTYRTSRKTTYYRKKTSYRTPKHAYSVKRVSYVAPSNTNTQVVQLKSQVAALQKENAEMKHQTQIAKLQAENASLRAQLTKQQAQQVRVAGVSKMNSGLLAVAGIVGLGLLGAGVVPGLLRKRSE